jgi:SAM-dependent methyltransferase
MERPDWVPADLELDQPNAARTYDYYLGGSHNLAVDRELAQRVIEAMPEVPLMARANRAFLRRAVLFCVEAGVRQFLDLGSGIPTVGNVHEVAQRAAPECRVVYVDVEPVAVAHARAILAGNARATVLQADIREPDRILADPALVELLDLSRPVAVLMVAVLPWVVDDDDVARIVTRFRDAVAPGSYLVVSHGTEKIPGAVREQYQRASSPFVVRSRAQVMRLFAGFELVDPGLVYTQQWRPDWIGQVEDHPEWSGTLAGVGRMP